MEFLGSCLAKGNILWVFAMLFFSSCRLIKPGSVCTTLAFMGSVRNVDFSDGMGSLAESCVPLVEMAACDTSSALSVAYKTADAVLGWWSVLGVC